MIVSTRNRSPTFTEDGFEITFGVNHLGHFLLTLLLLEDLKKCSPDARIIIVSSDSHNPESRGPKNPPAHIDFENLQLLAPGTFDAVLAYRNSKLANVLFSYELARRLHGSGVTCNCVAPGFMPQTGFLRHNLFFRILFICCFRGICRCLPLSLSTGEGADDVVFVAADEMLAAVSGKYFRKRMSVDSSQESMDREIAQKLWTLSADLVQVNAEV